MTSIIEDAPKPGLGEAIPIWMKVDWTPEIEQGIYKDWGSYYSRRRRENIAMHYYDKALKLSPEDFMTLYHRSQSKRKTAQTEGALSDSLEAARLARNQRGHNALINLEVCDALYELNQLENCKAELHNNTRLFTGNKTKAFEQRLLMVDETIKDVTGDCLSPFLSKYEKVVCHVHSILKAQNEIDNRPLWKILREQGKCDVLSIPEIEEELLSPLEIARRKRAFDVFNQTYLNDSWVDVIFLKHLRKNPSLLLDQCPYSKQFLKLLSSKQYDVIKKFLKMLECRNPLYYIRFIKYSNKKMLEKYKEDYLFRIQYQTRRNMITVLRSIRHLRENKNISKLVKYVEDVMGDYVVLKTHRVMPWKFEFMNEVYNTLALALVEQYSVPKSLKHTDKTALLRLLRLPTEKAKDFAPFVFGDRSSHHEPDLIDPAVIKARRLLSRLEKRMIFAKYSIEKCYLLHQIAENHLKQNRFDECSFIARKGIEESKQCNSNIWRFLSILLIIKANASLHKVERTKEALEMARGITDNLKSPRIAQFIDICLACNEVLHTLRKGSSVSASTSRRESKISSPSSAGISAEEFRLS